ncbi:MAG TPA: hypothetical protein VEZ20_11775 [Allosphingosinicella sp.]|jgi:hypothetical protein|nr:hypothetical protein [Allosphingosinicella sp.]
MMQLRLRRQQLSATFRTIARQLCEDGVRFSKSVPTANDRSLGPLAAGPGEDEELHFDWMSNASVTPWLSNEEAADLVRKALEACSDPDELVIVIWSPFEAGLRLSSRDLARHAPAVLDRAWTTWIVAAQPSRWIVQVGRFSQTVAFCSKVPVRTDSIHRRLPGAK